MRSGGARTSVLRAMLGSFGLLIAASGSTAQTPTGLQLSVEPGTLPAAVVETLAKDLGAALGEAVRVTPAAQNGRSFRVTGGGPRDGAVAVGLVASAPMVLIGRSSFPAPDGASLLEAVANLPAVTVVHDGPGTASERCGLLLVQILGGKAKAAPRAADLSIGRSLATDKADLACVEAPIAIPMVQAGGVTGFAIAGDERVSSIWDVPAAVDIGLPLLTATAWYGLYATPNAVSPDAILKANAALQKRLATDEAALADVGLTLFPATHRSPDAHQTFLATEKAAAPK